MKTVTVQEAESDLAALIEAVENGETVVIARDEQPVARLVPAGPQPEALSLREVVFRLNRIRDRVKMDGTSPQELIEEGRRY